MNGLRAGMSAPPWASPERPQSDPTRSLVASHGFGRCWPLSRHSGKDLEPTGSPVISHFQRFQRVHEPGIEGPAPPPLVIKPSAWRHCRSDQTLFQ